MNVFLPNYRWMPRYDTSLRLWLRSPLNSPVRAHHDGRNSWGRRVQTNAVRPFGHGCSKLRGSRETAIKTSAAGGKLPKTTLSAETETVLRQLFLKRAQHAIDFVARTASAETLTEALAMPSDAGMIAQAILDPAILQAALPLA